MLLTALDVFLSILTSQSVYSMVVRHGFWIWWRSQHSFWQPTLVMIAALAGYPPYHKLSRPLTQLIQIPNFFPPSRPCCCHNMKVAVRVIHRCDLDPGHVSPGCGSCHVALTRLGSWANRAVMTGRGISFRLAPQTHIKPSYSCFHHSWWCAPCLTRVTGWGGFTQQISACLCEPVLHSVPVNAAQSGQFKHFDTR